MGKKINNFNDSVTFVLNSKGGVGKSTFVGQVLVPFLFKMVNAKPEIIDESSKKIQIYDIDGKNNSSDVLSKSEIFNSELIKSTGKKLEDLLLEVLNSSSRDCPVVFDVGNTFTEGLLDALSNVFSDRVVNFIVPLKQDEDDVRNSISTINMIKDNYPNHNISIVCSDSICGLNDLEELKLEFEIVFGGYFDLINNKVGESLFQLAGIDENKFLAVKKTGILARSKIWTRKTIWESGLVGKEIRDHMNKNEFVQEFSQLREEAVKLKNDDKIEESNKINEKALVVAKKISMYKSCYTYSRDYLEDIFKNMVSIEMIK